MDPRWIYGLPLDLGSLYERAKQKRPECVCEGQRSATAISFIERYEGPLDTILNMEMGYDVFDDDLKPTLVLILHEEDYEYSELKLEDENFLRQELGIKEKGKWYRYVGAFGIEYLDDYKNRAHTFGRIPSRGDTACTPSNDGSPNDERLTDVKQLTKAVASVAV